MKYISLFVLTTVIFFAIDMVWLGVISKNFYREKLGFIFNGEVNWIPAIYFISFIYLAFYILQLYQDLVLETGN